MHIRKEKYQELLKTERNYKLMLKNALASFLFGGIIAVIGQAILMFYTNILDIEKDMATAFMIGTMVLLASLLTAFGVYDKIGFIGKAGTVIPITGFANSMVSSAMEYKPEGFVMGIGANIFKLAGSVIAFGVMSAYIVALIRFLLGAY